MCAPAPKAVAKETKQTEPKVEVKKEKTGEGDAPGGSRGSAEGQKRERKSRWDPDEAAKESTKREASTRPGDVDSRPGAAAREASGDDLHSALGRSSAKDAVAPLTALPPFSPFFPFPFPPLGTGSCLGPGPGAA